jgi:uncharacterized protein YidB (DUF937 family)
MSFLDNLKGAVGGWLGDGGAAALPGLIQKFYPGGLSALLDQLSQSGLGQQVNSWLGRGPNEPISAEDLRAALDNEQIRQAAERLGVPVDALLEQLASDLPDAVDQQSPDGSLQPPSPTP